MSVKTRANAAALLKFLAAILMTSLASACEAQAASDGSTSEAATVSVRSFRPTHWFVQAGAGQDVQALNAGLLWEWDRKWSVSENTHVSVLTEVSLGQWRTSGPGGTSHATNTQLGFTPAVRLWLNGKSNHGYFTEAGIGANFVTPIYRTNDKRFGTVFNFGSHIGFGYRLQGPTSPEWSLRLQHFSNAGIRRPNPGENFLQVRWTAPF